MKNVQISKFMKICPMGAELLKPDGHTERHDEVTAVFCNFANVPKKQMHDAVVAKTGTVQSVHILKTQCTVLQWAKKFN
jgi:hypothetical protein